MSSLISNGYSYDYGYGIGSTSTVAIVLTAAAVILAIAATVLAFIFIVPEKRRAKLNAFGKFLHDTCNFKYLLVEKILQALYIFATAFTILFGFFSLFRAEFAAGLGMMILGPIVLRLIYELFMMAVLLLKNVITINKKLKNQNDTTDNSADVFAAPDLSEVQQSIKARREAAQAQQPVQSAAPVQPVARFCQKCGTPLDESGNCPNCSK